MRLGHLTLFTRSKKFPQTVLVNEEQIPAGNICVPVDIYVIFGWKGWSLSWIRNERPRHSKTDTRLETGEFL